MAAESSSSTLAFWKRLKQKYRTRHWLTWLAFLVAGMNVLVAAKGIFMPEWHNDDAEFYYGWMPFAPGSFDLADIVRGYQPLLWYGFGTFLRFVEADLVLVSKLMTVFLQVLTYVALYRVGRKFAPDSEPQSACFLLLAVTHPFLFDRIVGGYPRGWSPFLILLALWVAGPFRIRQAWVLVLSALLNPIAFLVNTGILVWHHLLFRRRWKPAVALSGLALVLLTGLMLQQGKAEEQTGPFLRGTHEAFLPGGRGPENPAQGIAGSFYVQFYEEGQIQKAYAIFGKRTRPYKDALGQVLSSAVDTLKPWVLSFVLAGLVLLAAWRRWPVLPGPFASWLLSALLLFYAAHVMLYRLYLPGHYIYPATLFLPCWLLAFSLGRLWRRHPRWAGLCLALLLVTQGTGVHLKTTDKSFKDSRGARDFLTEEAPPGKVIGHPQDMDILPLRTGRPVYVFWEAMTPWRPRVYAMTKQRSLESLRLLYATAETLELKPEYGPFLMVRKEWFEPKYLEGQKPFYAEPMNATLLKEISDVPIKDFLFHPKHPSFDRDALLFEDKFFYVIDLDVLRRKHPLAVGKTREE